MRGSAALALAAVGLLCALSAAGSAVAGAETKIGVRAEEWNLILSRAAVDPGDAEIEYQNAGEDPHDLRLRRKGTSRVHSVAELQPSEVAELDLRLRRDSRYVMWCSTLDGLHRELGMEATLRVRRR
jgi:plastocyanin